MTNTPSNAQALKASIQQRREALQVALKQSETLVRQDFKDLKDDLNPIKQVKEAVQSFFTPHSSGKPSALSGYGLEEGLGLLVGKMLPSPLFRGLQTIAPALILKAAEHAAPMVKEKLETALEWIVEKTEKDPLETAAKAAEMAKEAVIDGIQQINEDVEDLHSDQLLDQQNASQYRKENPHGRIEDALLWVIEKTEHEHK